MDKLGDDGWRLVNMTRERTLSSYLRRLEEARKEKLRATFTPCTFVADCDVARGCGPMSTKPLHNHVRINSANEFPSLLVLPRPSGDFDGVGSF